MIKHECEGAENVCKNSDFQLACVKNMISYCDMQHQKMEGLQHSATERRKLANLKYRNEQKQKKFGNKERQVHLPSYSYNWKFTLFNVFMIGRLQ